MYDQAYLGYCQEKRLHMSNGLGNFLDLEKANETKRCGFGIYEVYGGFSERYLVWLDHWHPCGLLLKRFDSRIVYI